MNVGDLLSRWSNDILRSTLHRVVAPPATKINDREQMTPKRQSIAFFCNPNGGALVDCLPSCYDSSRTKKYAPVTTEQYIVQRFVLVPEVYCKTLMSSYSITDCQKPTLDQIFCWARLLSAFGGWIFFFVKFHAFAAIIHSSSIQGTCNNWCVT